jgi:Zn-dependent M28 family amino/carboxypeptidase
VLAKVQGTDPLLGNEVIVVGAHIDHLGFGESGIYRGADDNASGAAIVLELSRMFQKCGLTPKRTLLFAEWNAEEMGLLGSKYYVDHPTLPLSDTIALYNFDMVGGGDGSGILLFGGDDSVNRWLTDLMINASDEAGLDHVIQLVPQKLASDHAPFVGKGIPVCWGFARPDPHPGYHTPDDDMSRINPQSLRAVTELFWAALRPLAMGEEGNYLGSTEGNERVVLASPSGVGEEVLSAGCGHAH